MEPGVILPPCTSVRGRHEHKTAQFLHMPGVTAGAGAQINPDGLAWGAGCQAQRDHPETSSE